MKEKVINNSFTSDNGLESFITKSDGIRVIYKAFSPPSQVQDDNDDSKPVIVFFSGWKECILKYDDFLTELSKKGTNKGMLCVFIHVKTF